VDQRESSESSGGSSRPEAPSRGFAIALLLIGIAHLALFVFGIVRPEAPLRFDRAVHRLASVEAFANAGSVGERLSLLSSLGPPGDYLWQAWLWMLGGGSMTLLMIVQLGLSAFSLVAVHRIALLLDGRPAVARVAVVVYALIPIDFMVPHFLGSEAFANPLLVFALYALVRYVKLGTSLSDLVATSVLLALAAFTRPELIPWLPLPVALVFVRARADRGGVAFAHAGLLAALLCGVALGSVLHTRAPAAGERLTPRNDALGYEMKQRADQVEAVAADGGVHLVADDSPGASLLRVAAAHPLIFVREWALHTVKLLALPDNLDLFRYLGLYEYTGERAGLVHSKGILGAVVSIFREMPLLMTWMLAATLMWLGVWGLIAAGLFEAMARSDRWTKLCWIVLLALPMVAVLTRVITQGESRKRSLFDAALALFAAVGALALAERWRARRFAASRARPSA
jgi:hypothetical protein